MRRELILQSLKGDDYYERDEITLILTCRYLYGCRILCDYEKTSRREILFTMSKHLKRRICLQLPKELIAHRRARGPSKSRASSDRIASG